MSKQEPKRTPLFSYYQEKGLRLIDFGGWALPISFTKIQEEHEAVRKTAGLFDVSHMGEMSIRGQHAKKWLNTIVTNDLTKMSVNEAQYTTLVNEQGGTLDDLLVFQLAEDHFWLTPNAANTTKIWHWLKQQRAQNKVELENLSEKYGLLALQGPKAKEILSKLTDTDMEKIKPFCFLPDQTVASIKGVLISRTGYTGEDGFELYVPWESVRSLWEAFMAVGKTEGLQECGLGARDTLRLEAGMALYGHELSESVTPLEGGVGFAVKLEKDQEFIGQQTLKQQKALGLKQVSRGFELVGKGIAREGYAVLNQEKEPIGVVTSGTKSPTLGKSIGMMLIDKDFAMYGGEVLIQIRKKQIPAKITKKDWLRRK